DIFWGSKAQIVQEEEREKGRVGFSVYWKYITTAYGGALAPLIVVGEFQKSDHAVIPGILCCVLAVLRTSGDHNWYQSQVDSWRIVAAYTSLNQRPQSAYHSLEPA
nr:ABC transporter C family member 3-like [Tanacetum cinerariifolium]